MMQFIKYNQQISFWFDRIFLPEKFRTNGLKDYQRLVPQYIQKNQHIFDIGGGKIPFITIAVKQKYKLRVTGLDIDMNELNMAPKNIYDKKIVQDISEYRPKDPFADIVICEAVLEHVDDVDNAVAAITKSLKDGGIALIFIPCRNALFARINLLMPELLKRRILYNLFPESAHGQGFPAFYNHCTPSKFVKLCNKYGLKVEFEKAYYFVTYFSFFFPLHLLWRMGQILLYPFFKSSISEAFVIVATK